MISPPQEHHRQGVLIEYLKHLDEEKHGNEYEVPNQEIWRVQGIHYAPLQIPYC